MCEPVLEVVGLFGSDTGCVSSSSSETNRYCALKYIVGNGVIKKLVTSDLNVIAETPTTKQQQKTI